MWQRILVEEVNGRSPSPVSSLVGGAGRRGEADRRVTAAVAAGTLVDLAVIVLGDPGQALVAFRWWPSDVPLLSEG